MRGRIRADSLNDCLDRIPPTNGIGSLRETAMLCGDTGCLICLTRIEMGTPVWGIDGALPG